MRLIALLVPLLLAVPGLSLAERTPPGLEPLAEAACRGPGLGSANVDWAAVENALPEAVKDLRLEARGVEWNAGGGQRAVVRRFASAGRIVEYRITDHGPAQPAALLAEGVTVSPGIERRPLTWACRAGSTKLRKYYVRSAEGKRTVYDARLAIAVGTFFVEVHLMEATGVDDVVAAAAAIDVPSLVGSWR